VKALSIRQPWAWAIIHAGKEVENRDWKDDGPSMRQARTLQNSTILIHAGKGMTRGEYEDCLETMHYISGIRPFPSGLAMPAFTDLPRGGIVGRARLAGIIHDRIGIEYTRTDLTEARRSPWFFGPYGLVLTDVRPLPFTMINGALGFFDVRDSLVDEAA